MPLEQLGQLKPTMEQILALQKALMALAETGEGAERKPTGGLARGLAPYAGPTPTSAKEPSPLASGALASLTSDLELEVLKKL